MPLAHSLHLIVFTTWDADEDAEPETITYTDGTNARAMYDLLREDPTTRHARLFHNPVPNGGVFDGTRPVPPEPEPLESDDPPVNSASQPPLPDGASPPEAKPPPFAAATPAAPAAPAPPPATKPAESPELKLS